DVETDLRQFRQLGRDSGPLLRLGIRSCLDAVGRLLAQGRQVDIRLGFDGKLLNDICSRRRRLRAHNRGPSKQGQGTQQKADVAQLLSAKHQRYPAALIALLQFGVAFLVDSNRHCRPLTGSCRTSPHRCFNSQLHSFTSEVRAVMRCWMAPRAWGKWALHIAETTSWSRPR